MSLLHETIYVGQEIASVSRAADSGFRPRECGLYKSAYTKSGMALGYEMTWEWSERVTL